MSFLIRVRRSQPRCTRCAHYRLLDLCNTDLTILQLRRNVDDGVNKGGKESHQEWKPKREEKSGRGRGPGSTRGTGGCATSARDRATCGCISYTSKRQEERKRTRTRERERERRAGELEEGQVMPSPASGSSWQQVLRVASHKLSCVDAERTDRRSRSVCVCSLHRGSTSYWCSLHHFPMLLLLLLLLPYRRCSPIPLFVCMYVRFGTAPPSPSSLLFLFFSTNVSLFFFTYFLLLLL